jgi:hypothetical protein
MATAEIFLALTMYAYIVSCINNYYSLIIPLQTSFSGLEKYTWSVAKLIVPAFSILSTPLINHYLNM